MYTPGMAVGLTWPDASSVLCFESVWTGLADIDTVDREMAAWGQRSNEHGKPAVCRFINEDARMGFRTFYPVKLD